jgi:hypothetical protein
MRLCREKYGILIFLIITSPIPPVYCQNIDELIENIYQQTLSQEGQLDSLKNYSFVQKIHFIKMDGDGEIEEESRREFLVRVRSWENRHRELISALDFEDDQWVDVKEKEKNKKETENKSVSFSLTEMVSPEMRKNYNFNLIDEEFIDGFNTFHMLVRPFEEDEERFAGDLWFEKDSYALVKAILIPSDFPTAVEDMMMEFSIRKFGESWLPVKIKFEAEVSFLILFKGKILSEILFEEYLFEQTFPDSLFQ